MKSIKSAKWEIRMARPGACALGLFWTANTKDDIGINNTFFTSSRYFASERACYKNWEKFAMANGIPKRNWMYA